MIFVKIAIYYYYNFCIENYDICKNSNLLLLL